MANVTHSFTEIEAKYNHLSSEIEGLRAALAEAGPNAPGQYRENLDHLLHQQRLAHDKIRAMERTDVATSATHRTEVEGLLSSMEQELARLKTVISNETSIGWPEGQAHNRPEGSIGWAEGQADLPPPDSKGWSEGQSATPSPDSEGWTEGYDKR